MNKAEIRARLRPLVARAVWPLVRPFRRRLDVDRQGRALQEGITAVVAARNESYSIRLCLRSLLGFADQIVCVDNGSQDGTLDEMRRFKQEWSQKVEVDVISRPGALLGECREAGLDATRYAWHLRWDADMVGQTTGPDRLAVLRQRVLADRRPRAIQLERTNLGGDLRHTSRGEPAVDPGEPILMRFGRGISYREFGKFDAVRLPLHYLAVREPGRYCFHLAGLKPDENIIHRFHYFAWRELVNRSRPGAARPPDFETFKQERNLRLFGTIEPRSLKFRFQRQMVYVWAPYDEAVWGPYPELLRQELGRRQRFEIVYRDGRPYRRLDREDEEMLEYVPTDEDLRFDPEAFLRRLVSAEQCRKIGVDPEGP